MAERIAGFDPDDVMQAVAAVKDQVWDVARQANERFEIERRLREDPWVVLGVAAGAGFVLGGGLWPALRPLVKAAGRTVMAPSNLLALAAALGAMRASQQGGAGAEEPAGDITPTEH